VGDQIKGDSVDWRTPGKKNVPAGPLDQGMKEGTRHEDGFKGTK